MEIDGINSTYIPQTIQEVVNPPSVSEEEAITENTAPDVGQNIDTTA